jgi:outer membrane protein assembly factor BamB
MNDVQTSIPALQARRRRRTPPRWWWLLVGLAIIAILFLQNTSILGEPGLTNMVCVSLGILMVLILIAWLFFRSGFSWRIRWLGLGCVVIGLVLFFGSFRISVTGNMMPRLKPRSWVLYTLSYLNLADYPQPLAVASGEPANLATTTPDDFWQFLGPNRSNGIDNIKLSRSWEKNPPRLLWKQGIGEGWSGFAVVNGFAVTQEQRDDEEWITCYEVKTGKMRWSHVHLARHEDPMGGVGPRATPTIHNGKVYALGGTGVIFCLDGATGKEIWKKDLLQEFRISPSQESKFLMFGRANSPLIVKNLVVIPAGGPTEDEWVSLAAFDKNTGEKVWTGGKWQPSYSSPVLARLADVDQILIVNQDRVSGHDPGTGKVLWDFEWPGKSSQDANSSQAVPVAPDKVFVSKGYTQGSALYQLEPKANGMFEPKQIWHEPKLLRTKFTNVAMKDGLVFGLSDGLRLDCVELATGKKVWSERGFGHGQILRVGDLLLVQSEEERKIFLVAATADRDLHVLGSIEGLNGITWNNLALYGRYLLVRNATEAACFELPVE